MNFLKNIKITKDNGILLFLFVIIAIIAIIQIPARIASKKGHSFIGFLVFAIFFYPFALIVALLIGDKTSYSSEADKAEALTKFKICGINSILK